MAMTPDRKSVGCEFEYRIFFFGKQNKNNIFSLLNLILNSK